MKKIKPILLSMLMLFSFLFTPNCADAAVAGESVTYLDDGCRIVTTIEDEPSIGKKPGIQPYALVYEKTRSKISNYLNASGEVMWYVKVTGTFRYDGTTATCLSAGVTAEAFGSTWKISKRSAARSGATAMASATAKQYLANLYVGKIDELVKLTCDKNGNLS